MFDYLQKLRSKPEHVREQIAFGTAGVIAALIFVAWLAAFVAQGGLAFTPPGIAPTSLPAENSQSANVLSGFLGASAANKTSEKQGGIEVVETRVSSTLEKEAEPSSIPF